MRDHRLFAEALACPFVDPKALSWPEGVDHRQGTTCLEVRLRAFGASEQAGDWWSAAWHGHCGWLEGLHHHATALLQPGGRAWRLKVDRKQPGREILRWRAISQRLPAGLLMAAAAGGDAPAWQVQVLDDVLVPRGPFAHLHLHGNAVSAFEVIWTDQMTRRRVAPGPVWWSDWPALRARARLVRLLLARWVETGGDLVDVGKQIFGHHAGLVGQALASWPCVQVLSPEDEADLDNLTERLKPLDRPRPESLTEVWQNDLLSVWYRGRWPEGQWLSKALLQVRADGTKDTPHARRMLLGYLRLKCGLAAWLRADPAERGLGAFTRTFDRANEFTRPLDALLPEQAELDPVLRPDSIELRTSPSGIMRWLKEGLPQRGSWRESGLVAHFIRTAEETKPAVERMSFFRHQAEPIVDALNLDPSLQRCLRAVDLAGDERRGPLWVLVPALRMVLDQATANARRCHVPPLRTTFHVGEDFGHLLSGLRAVDEPLAWGLTGRGDRLGHALALGLDVERWCARHPRLPVRRVDRLLDLGWAWGRIDGLTELSHAERGAWLMGLRQELASLMPEGVNPDQAPRLFQRLGDPDWLSTLEDRMVGPEADLFGWWKRWSQADAEAGRILESRVDITTAHDMPLMQLLQRAIAADLSALQVVIELNPTSNLCIGGLEHLVDQPLFRMRPWSGDSAFGMPVTISTDDPLQLATCLSDEYAYAWAGLVLGGKISPIEANAWMARVAEDGWRGRFTLAAP